MACAVLRYVNKHTNINITMQEKNMWISVFSARLRSAMKANLLTQSKLAEITKIRQTTVSDYLNGKTVPAADVFMRLAQALGVSMEWLCGQDTEGSEMINEMQAKKEVMRLKAKLRNARKTLEGAYELALEALILEEEIEEEN